MNVEQELQNAENNKINYLESDANNFGSYKLVKRFIKKLISWLIIPVVRRQNDFNENIMTLLKNYHFMQENEKQLDEAIVKKQDELEKRIELLKQYQEENQKVIAKATELLNQHEDKMNKISDIYEENDDFWRKTSVAQTGEDMIIAYILRVLGIEPQKISYLDLGANHGKDLSNTYYFYKQGARGVLVEANPDLIAELKLFRSGDNIVNRCIASKDNEYLHFYILNGDGLSSCDKDSVEDAIEKNPSLFIEKEVDVETITVNTLLQTYFSKAPTILNIDIEGMEMEVLEQIDFKVCRPFIVICEMIPYRPELVVGEKNRELLEFMEQNNYQEFAFTGINSIFIDRLSLKEEFKL